MIKRILTVSLGFFLLAGCSSLSPSKTTTETTTMNNKGQQGSINTSTEYSDDLVKKSTRLELVHHFKEKHGESLLNNTNTQFSTRPYQSVFVLKGLGHNFFKKGIHQVIATHNGDRVVFDMTTTQNLDNETYIVLKMMEDVPVETFKEYEFSLDLITPQNTIVKLEKVPVSDTSEINTNVNLGQIAKVNDSSYILFYNQNVLTLSQQYTNSGHYNLNLRSLILGEELSINRSDIKINLVSDKQTKRLSNTEFLIYKDKDGSIVDTITKSGFYKFSFNSELNNSDFDKENNLRLEISIGSMNLTVPLQKNN